jgi:hypothetical protein
MPKVSKKRQAQIDAGEIPKYPTRKPIARSTKPLKRGTVKIAKVSAKRKVLNVEYKKVRDDFMAAHPFCQFSGCIKRATDCHHAKGKVGKDFTDDTHFIALCRVHHNWVHDFPAEAMELGYSINRLS